METNPARIGWRQPIDAEPEHGAIAPLMSHSLALATFSLQLLAVCGYLPIPASLLVHGAQVDATT